MQKLSLKDYLTYFAPAIVMTLAGFAVAYQFIDPAPPRQITIATGRSTGVYYEFAHKFSQILDRDGVTLKVKETSGSVENLNLITDKSSGVDVIFLQGGVGALASTDDLLSLGSLYFEPLWIFHRAEIQVNYLADLKGMRIAVGIEGSGTKVLAMQLLALNGINVVNSHIE
jgi:TRAP transporter TAXI family solute receptor